MENKLQVPKETKKDTAHSLAKATISLIPFVGGAASEIFSLIVPQSIAKRRKELLESLVLELEKLHKRIDGLEFENMLQNEEFISFLIETSQIAIKTHHEKKLSYLKNCISSFFEINIDFDKKYTFLKLIDNLSFTHFDIFHFISKNEVYIQKNIKSFANLHELYTKKNKRKIGRDYFRKFVRDLDYESLIRISGDFEDFYGSEAYMEIDGGASSIKVLKNGKDFLKFIKQK